MKNDKSRCRMPENLLLNGLMEASFFCHYTLHCKVFCQGKGSDNLSIAGLQIPMETIGS